MALLGKVFRVYPTRAGEAAVRAVNDLGTRLRPSLASRGADLTIDTLSHGTTAATDLELGLSPDVAGGPPGGFRLQYSLRRWPAGRRLARCLHEALVEATGLPALPPRPAWFPTRGGTALRLIYDVDLEHHARVWDAIPRGIFRGLVRYFGDWEATEGGDGGEPKTVAMAEPAESAVPPRPGSASYCPPLTPGASIHYFP